MLKKSFCAFQTPFSPCCINNANKSNSTVRISDGLNHRREPNALCRHTWRWELFSLLGIGWNTATVQQHDSTWGTGTRSRTVFYRKWEEFKVSQSGSWLGHEGLTVSWLRKFNSLQSVDSWFDGVFCFIFPWGMETYALVQLYSRFGYRAVSEHGVCKAM